MNDDLLLSEAGLSLSELDEGLRLVAYPDPGSVDGHPWTIGYGHTGPDVHRGMTCTKEQAEVWMEQDVAWAENAVRQLVKVRLTQGQFDALVDFTFNVGAHAFETSTLLKRINAGDLGGADDEFSKWVLNDGKKLNGLVVRREHEAAMFNV